MFPIKDTIRSRSFPIVTWGIIAANVIVFFYELTLSSSQQANLFQNYGLVASQFKIANPLTWYPLFTHMWLHGGWLHIISNMWVLFIFGDNVEDRLGSGRFLIFYVIGGFAAGLIQVFFAGGNNPAIGASGAIAAVLGAYFIFFPRAKVLTLFLIVIIPIFLNIPAVIFIGLWFIIQLFSGLLALAGSAGSAGIAWWAHVGGFLFGLIMSYPFTAGRGGPKWHRDEYYPW
jgi:membrane associated rhomboid family serine protease